MAAAALPDVRAVSGVPWVTPEPKTDEERERHRIRDSIPAGWASRHIRLEYDVDPASVGTNPLWGICGHRHVCLLAGGWRHPFPSMPRVCDDEPKLTHANIHDGTATGMIGDGNPTEYGWIDRDRGVECYHPPWGPEQFRQVPRAPARMPAQWHIGRWWRTHWPIVVTLVVLGAAIAALVVVGG